MWWWKERVEVDFVGWFSYVISCFVNRYKKKEWKNWFEDWFKRNWFVIVLGWVVKVDVSVWLRS